MGGGAAALQKDVPWRASSGAKPIPKIHYSPVLRIPQNPLSDYALSIMKHPDPIGSGLGTEAIVEAAGPDCIVPGQNPPIKLLGLKVWPIEVDLKFMEPVGRELKSVGKFMDSAVDLMNKSFIDPTLASYIRRVTLLVCGNHKYSLMASQLTMQEEELRRGQWLEEEDEKLSMMVAVFGERRWDALAKTSGLKRSGKSCRLRWLNYLRPNLKHGHITADEERLIILLQKQFGNKWSKIAKQLPGRTDNEIKNYWRSHLRKKTLIYKQESSGSNTSNSEQRSSILKRDTVLNSSSNSEDTYSEKGDCSSADFFAYSSNEVTLLDWIPSWSYEQSRMEHHMYFCSSNLCSCYPP